MFCPSPNIFILTAIQGLPSLENYICSHHSVSSSFCAFLSKSVAWLMCLSYQIFSLLILPKVLLLLTFIFVATVQCLPFFVLHYGIQFLVFVLLLFFVLLLLRIIFIATIQCLPFFLCSVVRVNSCVDILLFFIIFTLTTVQGVSFPENYHYCHCAVPFSFYAILWKSVVFGLYLTRSQYCYFNFSVVFVLLRIIVLFAVWYLSPFMLCCVSPQWISKIFKMVSLLKLIFNQILEI